MLFVRTRSRPDPVEEAVEELRERARDTSEQLAARAREAREASEPAIERAREATERAREASEPAIERAREATERAREASGPALERAREASAPLLAQLVPQLRRLFSLLARLASYLPGIGSRVLGWFAWALGALADRTAQVADVKPPRTIARRGRRRRAVLWFTGGFAVGAAAGYAANELLAHDDTPHEFDESWPTAVPDPADATARPAEG